MQLNDSSIYDNSLGILLKTKQIVPYSKVPSNGYTLDEVIGIVVKDSENNICFCIHPSIEKKCYFCSGDMIIPENYSGIISGDVTKAIKDLDGFNNTQQMILTGRGDTTWACKYSNSVEFSGLQGYTISLGESKYIETLLTPINFLLNKCNGLEITSQNYWTSTINKIITDTNIINSSWITNFNGYRDGANVQAQMFVRPIAKCPEDVTYIN